MSEDLFNEIQKKLQESKAKNLEGEMEEKMKIRNEQLFKNKSTLDDIRSDIYSNELNIKKDKRENDIEIRRKLKQTINIENTIQLKDRLNIDPKIYEDCYNMEVQREYLNTFVEKFNEDNLTNKYIGIVGIRKILSLAASPPIQEVIDQGLVYEFIKLLDHEWVEFQFEAVWCLTNISSGNSDQTMSVLNKGGAQKLIAMMDNKIKEIQEQAIWAVGNIAGDCVKIRDKMINYKSLDKINFYLRTTERQSLIKTCVWSLSNFCRGKPAPPFELFAPFLQLIVKNIYKYRTDNDFLIDAIWVLSYVTEHHKKSIKIIIDLGILSTLLSFLEIDIHYIQLPTLRILGNIVSGNAKQTQKVIDSNGLKFLKQTLVHSRKSIRKETCWILSNIAAGTQLQIEALILEDFLPLLEKIIKFDDVEIKKEAIWAVCNFSSIDNKQMAEIIIKQGIIELICFCLKNNDAKFIAVSLEALGNLLNFGVKFFNENGKNLVVKRIEELDMYDTLESLQLHPVEVVYEKTIRLLELYFDIETQN